MPLKQVESFLGAPQNCANSASCFKFSFDLEGNRHTNCFEENTISIQIFPVKTNRFFISRDPFVKESFHRFFYSKLKEVEYTREPVVITTFSSHNFSHRCFVIRKRIGDKISWKLVSKALKHLFTDRLEHAFSIISSFHQKARDTYS